MFFIFVWTGEGWKRNYGAYNLNFLHWVQTKILSCSHLLFGISYNALSNRRNKNFLTNNNATLKYEFWFLPGPSGFLCQMGSKKKHVAMKLQGIRNHRMTVAWPPGFTHKNLWFGLDWHLPNKWILFIYVEI